MYELGTDRAWDRGFRGNMRKAQPSSGLVSSSTWFEWRHCNIQNNKANKLIMLYTTIHIPCFGQFKASKFAYLSTYCRSSPIACRCCGKLGAPCRISLQRQRRCFFNTRSCLSRRSSPAAQLSRAKTSDLSILRFSRDLASSQSFNHTSLSLDPTTAPRSHRLSLTGLAPDILPAY
jgi:hypothetical protein